MKMLKPFKEITRLTINKQFKIGFTSLLLIIFVVGFFVVSNTNQMKKEVELLNFKFVPAVKTASSIDHHLSKELKRIYGEEAGISFTDSEGLTDQERFDEIGKGIDKLKEYIKDEKTLKALNMLKAYNNDFIEINKEMKDSEGMMKNILLKDLRTLEGNINTVNEYLKEYNWNRLYKTLNDVIEESEANRKKIIIINLIGMMITFILGLTINKGIDKVTSKIKSETYQAVNKSEAVNDSAQDMKNIADELEDKVTESYEVIQNLMDGNNEISEAVEEVAIAIKEISTGITELSEKAEFISLSGKETYDTIKVTNQRIKSGSEIVNRAADAMGELQTSVAKINKFSDKIMQITDQTNLLALNAAIEAARVSFTTEGSNGTRRGEAGLGFAVVAEEIKDLANESMEANKEVKKMTDEIEDVVKVVVAMMSKSSDQEDNVVNIFSEINDLVTDITTRMEGVTNSAQDQAVASEQLSSLTEQISASSEEVSSQSQEALVSVNEMGEIIKEVTKANTDLYFKIQDQAKISKEQLNLINNVVEVNQNLK
ncbi:methyl-accepting chemotaxis protein [Orenia marismortui]|uniref:methyl-accepting chemotaxis protein n=1 Tax=Orenia marismortui TaxID=46469 RepID=UPI00035D86B0|nr:methyl-accepting chemotaxis protein [Orenia marismortui]